MRKAPELNISVSRVPERQGVCAKHALRAGHRCRGETSPGEVVKRSLADLEGSFRCDTGSGACDVRGFRGDRLSLDTGSGRLRLVAVQARVVDADTGSGDVEAELRSAARVRADTGSGDVKIDVDTGSGDVTVEPLS